MFVFNWKINRTNSIWKFYFSKSSLLQDQKSNVIAILGESSFFLFGHVTNWKKKDIYLAPCYPSGKPGSDRINRYFHWCYQCKIEQYFHQYFSISYRKAWNKMVLFWQGFIHLIHTHFYVYFILSTGVISFSVNVSPSANVNCGIDSDAKMLPTVLKHGNKNLSGPVLYIVLPSFETDGFTVTSHHKKLSVIFDWLNDTFRPFNIVSVMSRRELPYSCTCIAMQG